MPASSDPPKMFKIFSKFLTDEFAENLLKAAKSTSKQPATIQEILKLPIYAYKFLPIEEAKIIEELLDVFDIEGASKLNKTNPFDTLFNLESTEDPITATDTREKMKKQVELLKLKFPDLENHLKRAITLSALVTEGKEEVEKIEQKVIVVGLDNAGKTAILSKFGGSLGIGDLAALKPTKGIERKKIETSALDLIVWDFGGQDEYREKYMKTPERYFLEIDLLIYVIDVQDQDRFEESIEYFTNIIDILETLEENPHVLIFIHKFDPAVKNDPAIQLNVEFIKDKLKALFEKKKLDIDYEIYLTSIYSLISNEPQFSKYIKNVMKTGINLSDPAIRKIEGLGKVLEEIMNAVVRLSESISMQIIDIDNRLRAIESGAFSIAQTGVPIEIQTPNESAQAGGGNTRTKVLDELKDLFAKKKKLDLS